MKLTKDERFTAYVIMLAESTSAVQGYYSGFCELINEVLDLRVHVNIDDTFEQTFPEIFVPKRNRRSYGFFFKSYDWTKRNELLLTAIKETHP